MQQVCVGEVAHRVVDHEQKPELVGEPRQSTQIVALEQRVGWELGEHCRHASTRSKHIAIPINCCCRRGRLLLLSVLSERGFEAVQVRLVARTKEGTSQWVHSRFTHHLQGVLEERSG